MSQSSNIISGPPIEKIPTCSFSEYMYPKLKNISKKRVIQVDAESGTTMTADELLKSGIKMSRALKSLGINQGDVVALFSRNTLEASVCVLGCFLSGVIISPANGFMKEMELEHILRIIKPKLLFLEEDMVPKAENVFKNLHLQVQLVITDKEKSSYPHNTYAVIMKKENSDGYTPVGCADPASDVATLLPSSGTSGLPKEVAITHRNLIFQDLSLKNFPVFKDTGMDCLQVSHYFWVTGMMFFVKSLTSGMKRILIKTPDLVSIMKAIPKYKAQWFLVGPMNVVNMVEHPDFPKYNMSSLKYVMVGGSPLTTAIADRFKGKFGNKTLFAHNYGATEMSGPATILESGNVLSTGNPTPGVSIKIVDQKTGKNLPAKEVGEIRVKSEGLMKCYWGNEQATKEAFDADGFWCTGDVGYYNENKQFFVVDRLKEMIKVKDMQIAPAEVENVISGLQAVQEVAVVGVSKDGGDCLLVAMVVKKKNQEVTEDEVMNQVNNNLSDYKKLTGGVFFVEGLPKNANGKVQRPQIQAIARELCFGN